MENEQLIKEVVKEMIRDGEITIKHELYQYSLSYDNFGNSSGGLESIELEFWLEVNDE